MVVYIVVRVNGNDGAAIGYLVFVSSGCGSMLGMFDVMVVIEGERLVKIIDSLIKCLSRKACLSFGCNGYGGCSMPGHRM